MPILVRNRQRKIERFFSSFSSHFPAAVHFEMIQLCAALLNTHRFAKSHPEKKKSKKVKKELKKRLLRQMCFGSR